MPKTNLKSSDQKKPTQRFDAEAVRTGAGATKRKLFNAMSDEELIALQQQISAVQKKRKKQAKAKVLHGTMRFYSETQRRFVDEDDDFDAELDHTLVVVRKVCSARREEHRMQKGTCKHSLGQDYGSVLFQHLGSEINCYLGSDGTCCREKELSDAAIEVYNSEWFRWNKICVAGGIWRHLSKQKQDAFLQQVVAYGTSIVYVLDNCWLCD